jgi:hypothetical protein
LANPVFLRMINPSPCQPAPGPPLAGRGHASHNLRFEKYLF